LLICGDDSHIYFNIIKMISNINLYLSSTSVTFSRSSDDSLPLLFPVITRSPARCQASLILAFGARQKGSVCQQATTPTHEHSPLSILQGERARVRVCSFTAKGRHWCHCERPARHASPQGEAGGSEAVRPRAHGREAISINVST